MGRETVIALVGKPSSGKSTTLNSLTDANAKVGAFPFTTIDPNKATGYLEVECACSRMKLQSQCKPNYGYCRDGKRGVPIMLLDVAGLVPNAHLGRGLGNKFLGDLTEADALIHIVDASGTTNAEGKATRGYDPLADIEWLQDEIFRWILGNLTERWGSVVRRHTATKSSTLETLRAQLGGYSANKQLIGKALDLLPGLAPLQEWDNETIEKVVKAFMKVKFPTILALNKMDHPDADKNVSKIILKYPDTKAVLTSSITEVFLRKLAGQGYIKYDSGTEFIDTADDIPGLKPLDDKLRNRIENIRDLVLYRFGSTGVVQLLQAAAETLDLIPFFPVRSMNFNGEVFRDCVLVKRGTPVILVARKIMGEVTIASIEGVGGNRVSEDDTVDVGKNDILSFKVVPGGR
ncbi:P-loop containing nucleoside triphosphate hydrolase protein [Suhomyces tanzawaensis NRRL Y-17324]|uniref:p-loop containing nucleoside triphosphate hydrolase protein n=1 Tax=Suhomyces tanzawaensis NRRL Y-17324 TaxID=984487 RepID=A0A1E4SI31_9ASCO|nr:P-loop containing nucleoside triphosphate hydrolase protein [Suhomyces tanzawaensis NRRL Y-17324]ODV79174.1 P-loop containing nucleoside triphosphate hydrolase protein [Suhomyces tanzawaensis NRRL Y-17324]